MVTSPASSPGHAGSPSSSPEPGSRHDWDRVHVERVEMERAVPPSGVACVRAGLYLGRLLPVDVEVQLGIVGEDDAAAPATTLEPMWSAWSYHNGSFLFETHVPDARLAGATQLSVHVRPRDRRYEGRALVTITPSSELRRVVAPDAREDPPR